MSIAISWNKTDLVISFLPPDLRWMKPFTTLPSKLERLKECTRRSEREDYLQDVLLTGDEVIAAMNLQTPSAVAFRLEELGLWQSVCPQSPLRDALDHVISQLKDKLSRQHAFDIQVYPAVKARQENVDYLPSLQSNSESPNNACRSALLEVETRPASGCSDDWVTGAQRGQRGSQA